MTTPTYRAPLIDPSQISLGPQFEDVVALTVEPYGHGTNKIRWTLNCNYQRLAVTADLWTSQGWVLIWELSPHTEVLGTTKEERAERATAAFQELEPFINLILQP